MNLERGIHIQAIGKNVHERKHPLIVKRSPKLGTIILESSFQSHFPFETKGCILPGVPLSEKAHSDPPSGVHTLLAPPPWCARPWTVWPIEGLTSDIFSHEEAPMATRNQGMSAVNKSGSSEEPRLPPTMWWTHREPSVDQVLFMRHPQPKPEGQITMAECLDLSGFLSNLSISAMTLGWLNVNACDTPSLKRWNCLAKKGNEKKNIPGKSNLLNGTKC